jgi:hypothetical protein
MYKIKRFLELDLPLQGYLSESQLSAKGYIRLGIEVTCQASEEDISIVMWNLCLSKANLWFKKEGRARTRLN